MMGIKCIEGVVVGIHEGIHWARHRPLQVDVRKKFTTNVWKFRTHKPLRGVLPLGRYLTLAQINWKTRKQTM